MSTHFFLYISERFVGMLPFLTSQSYLLFNAIVVRTKEVYLWLKPGFNKRTVVPCNLFDSGTKRKVKYGQTFTLWPLHEYWVRHLKTEPNILSINIIIVITFIMAAKQMYRVAGKTRYTLLFFQIWLSGCGKAGVHHFKWLDKANKLHTEIFFWSPPSSNLFTWFEICKWDGHVTSHFNGETNMKFSSINQRDSQKVNYNNDTNLFIVKFLWIV